MKGGSQFEVYNPIIVISTQVMFCIFLIYFYLVLAKNSGKKLCIVMANDLQSELVYCLAVVQSSELNIIGRKSSS